MNALRCYRRIHSGETGKRGKTDRSTGEKQQYSMILDVLFMFNQNFSVMINAIPIQL